MGAQGFSLEVILDIELQQRILLYFLRRSN